MKSSRTALVVCLVAACALALWLVTRPTARASVESATARGTTHGATTAPRAELDADPAVGSMSAQPATPSADDAERAPAASMPNGPADGVDVLVVEKTTGLPIANASVRAVGGARAEAWSRRFHPPFVDWETFAADASEARTDANGRARIPIHSMDGWCVARNGALYGELELRVDLPVPLRIELEPDRDIVLRVVDAAGHPKSGVPVGLFRGDARAPAWESVSAGADGLARVRHVQLAARRYQPDARVAVGIVALHDTPPVEIDLADPPSAPVQLVCPELGTVEVLLRGPENEPEAVFGVALVDADALGAAGSVRAASIVLVPTTLERGRAVFENVGLGRRVAAYLERVHGVAPRVVGAGPTRAGESVTLRLEVPDPTPWITARVLDEHGELLADRLLHYEARTVRGVTKSEVITDAQARMRLPLAAGPGQSTKGTLTLTFRDDDTAVSRTQVELPEGLVLGDNDLGDIRFAEPALLATVRVVDDAGQPLPQANVRVLHPTSRVGERQGFEPDTVVLPRRGKDASFELRGPAATGALRVVAFASGYVTSAPLDFTPPRSDLTLVMTRASRIQGRVLVDPGVATSTLLVVAVPRGDVSPDLVALDGVVTTRVREDGTFELRDVRPGRFDLVFQENRGGPGTFTIEDVRLEPGEAVNDSRVTLVDLRGYVPAPAKPELDSRAPR